MCGYLPQLWRKFVALSEICRKFQSFCRKLTCTIVRTQLVKYPPSVGFPSPSGGVAPPATPLAPPLGRLGRPFGNQPPSAAVKE